MLRAAGMLRMHAAVTAHLAPFSREQLLVTSRSITEFCLLPGPTFHIHADPRILCVKLDASF